MYPPGTVMIHAGTFDDPQFKKLPGLLGVDEATAYGALTWLWMTCGVEDISRYSHLDGSAIRGCCYQRSSRQDSSGATIWGISSSKIG